MTGEPQPIVRWHHANSPTVALTTSEKYDVTHGGTVLVVRNAAKADEGNYECVAQNVAGMTHALARLTVWGQ